MEDRGSKDLELLHGSHDLKEKLLHGSKDPGGRAPPLTLGPERPRMGEEFPGQEFRGRPRAPAAFGGIMDTYTGRRKYGLGSFIKKAFKKVKKLASSKIGKLALMYVAGTYLGGTQAFGGSGYACERSRTLVD